MMSMLEIWAAEVYTIHSKILDTYGRTQLRCWHRGGHRVIVNIQDDILKMNALGLLDKLLADRTMKRCIM